jgi:hypothetical protein
MDVLKMHHFVPTTASAIKFRIPHYSCENEVHEGSWNRRHSTAFIAVRSSNSLHVPSFTAKSMLWLPLQHALIHENSANTNYSHNGVYVPLKFITSPPFLLFKTLKDDVSERWRKSHSEHFQNHT